MKQLLLSILFLCHYSYGVLAAAEPGKLVYEFPNGSLPADWKGMADKNLSKGVWQISEQESDHHHVAAPKIKLPAQNFITEFE